MSFRVYAWNNDDEMYDYHYQYGIASCGSDIKVLMPSKLAEISKNMHEKSSGITKEAERSTKYAEDTSLMPDDIMMDEMPNRGKINKNELEELGITGSSSTGAGKRSRVYGGESRGKKKHHKKFDFL